MDVQNDFCPGGALGIPGADKIVPVVNKYVKLFQEKKLPIFATRDWHPVRTRHFKDFGGAWPVHCIYNSKGAQFHPKLRLPKTTVNLYKGMSPQEDSYSIFQAEDEKGMLLSNLLKLMSINEIYLAGLATDYCVKFSTVDAIKKGFKVKVLTDAIKGVDLNKGDSEKALKEMTRLGAKLLTIKQLKIG